VFRKMARESGCIAGLEWSPRRAGVMWMGAARSAIGYGTAGPCVPFLGPYVHAPKGLQGEST
jgi:hypothetical protein